MHNRLSHNLQTNNMVVPEQFVFRNRMSTGNTSFKLTDSVLKSINQKMHVSEIFCDLAKTFDCVNNKIVLTKLNSLSLSLSLFRSRRNSKLVQILPNR
jgi:hypothetical protein